MITSDAMLRCSHIYLLTLGFQDSRGRGVVVQVGNPLVNTPALPAPDLELKIGLRDAVGRRGRGQGKGS